MQHVTKTITRTVGVVLIAAAVATCADAQQSRASASITSPTISEDVAPLERIAPTARDGSRREVFLRKPPGPGPFPAAVLIQGGITRMPTAWLREYALGSWSSRFLAAGWASRYDVELGILHPLHEGVWRNAESVSTCDSETAACSAAEEVSQSLPSPMELQLPRC
jgi:hypothetical protein